MENSLEAYTRRIWDIPLLSRQEEERLGKRIEDCHKGIVKLLCEYSYQRKNGGLELLKKELKENRKKKKLAGLLTYVEEKEKEIIKGKEEEVGKYANELFEKLIDKDNPFPKDRFKIIGKNLTEKLEREFGSRKDKRWKKVQTGLEEYLKKEKEIKKEFIEHNLRLVLSVAGKYFSYKIKDYLKGMDFLDIVQEGNLGLMMAVDRFDYQQGYGFATFALYWIRQFIGRGIISQGKTIRMPVSGQELVSKYIHTERELERQLGREPEFEEVWKEMVKKGKRLNAGKLNAGPKYMKAYLKINEMRLLSLEKKVGENWKLGDLIKEVPDRERDYGEKDLREALPYLLCRLAPDERWILQQRFGLGGGGEHTLDEVGKELELTREGIRQKEERILKRLREPAEKAGLKDYIEVLRQ